MQTGPANDDDVVLEMKDLDVGYYRDLNIIQGLNIKARRNQITAVLGANGVGKSTAMKAAFGFLTPNAGDVLLEGESILSVPTYQRILKGLSAQGGIRARIATWGIVRRHTTIRHQPSVDAQPRDQRRLQDFYFSRRRICLPRVQHARNIFVQAGGGGRGRHLLRRVADAVLDRLDGCRGVRNHLAVAPADPVADEAIWTVDHEGIALDLPVERPEPRVERARTNPLPYGQPYGLPPPTSRC